MIVQKSTMAVIAFTGLSWMPLLCAARDGHKAVIEPLHKCIGTSLLYVICVYITLTEDSA
jgi:hypothetical protein